VRREVSSKPYRHYLLSSSFLLTVAELVALEVSAGFVTVETPVLHTNPAELLATLATPTVPPHTIEVRQTQRERRRDKKEEGGKPEDERCRGERGRR
jgi:hypothetical protein